MVKKKIKPRCPNCQKPVVTAWRPFCSARCRDLDLRRWLDGHYAIPVIGQEPDEEGAPSPGGLDHQ